MAYNDDTRRGNRLEILFRRDVSEMGKEIKIILADDNRNICQMLQNYLQAQEDINIVGVAYNG